MENNHEIMNLYFDLGRVCHNKHLGHDIDDNLLENISKEIIALEIQGFDLGIPKEEEMICPSCSSPYDEESLFCTECGQDLKAFYQDFETCSMCKNMKKKEDEYCGACGAKKGVER